MKQPTKKEINLTKLISEANISVNALLETMQFIEKTVLKKGEVTKAVMLEGSHQVAIENLKRITKKLEPHSSLMDLFTKRAGLK